METGECWFSPLRWMFSLKEMIFREQRRAVCLKGSQCSQKVLPKLHVDHCINYEHFPQEVTFVAPFFISNLQGQILSSRTFKTSGFQIWTMIETSELHGNTRKTLKMQYLKLGWDLWENMWDAWCSEVSQAWVGFQLPFPASDVFLLRGADVMIL